MGLEFKDKAIVLSGVAGTRLKTSVLGNYYYFWHKVQSGGEARSYRYSTSIVDLNAGTGLIYIDDEDEIIRGSAGHALDLKYATPDIGTNNLRLYLIENDLQCRLFLIENMEEKWDLHLTSRRDLDYPLLTNGSVWLFESEEHFLRFTGGGAMIERGLFLFDPLLAPEYGIIERVAQHRLRAPFQIRTEFLLFFFTSDWISGRTGFAPLPRSTNEAIWTEEEKATVNQADDVFGDRSWLTITSSGQNDGHIQNALLNAYVLKMMKWFRFVLPVPFQPRTEQMYHLLCCSNYEVGINAIKSNWAHLVSMHKGNLIQSGVTDHANSVYPDFKRLHPELIRSLPTRMRRPLEWKILWQIAKSFVDGTADSFDRSLLKIVPDQSELDTILKWLADEHYILQVSNIPWAWELQEPLCRYRAAYDVLSDRLGLSPLIPMEPLTSDTLAFHRCSQETDFLSSDSRGNLIEIRMRCPLSRCRNVIATNGPIRIPPTDTMFLSCQNVECGSNYEIKMVESETGDFLLRLEGTPIEKPFWYRETEY